MLAIQSPWHPGEAVGGVEGRQSVVPWKHPRIDEEHIPGEGNESHLSHVWVLEVDCAVFDVVAAPQQKFSLTIKFKGFRWLVYFIGSFKILSSSLLQFSLGSIHYLMQVMYLSELSDTCCSEHH